MRSGWAHQRGRRGSHNDDPSGRNQLVRQQRHRRDDGRRRDAQSDGQAVRRRHSNSAESMKNVRFGLSNSNACKNRSNPTSIGVPKSLIFFQSVIEEKWIFPMWYSHNALRIENGDKMRQREKKQADVKHGIRVKEKERMWPPFYIEISAQSSSSSETINYSKSIKIVNDPKRMD